MDLPKFAYFQGKIVPYSDAKVGVLTHALNYGTAAFGGLRAYWNATDQQLYLFRPLDHFKRFLTSARLLLMHFDLTPEDLAQRTVELLRAENHSGNMYVRPLAYKSDETIGVKLHHLNCDISIVAIPFELYIANDTGAHATFSSWRRVDDNMIPARGKISGAYANSAFIKTDAMQAGFDEALVLTHEGHISEGSAMNVFLVRDGVVYTPPVTENILEGITRRTAIELLTAELGIGVVERPLDRTEAFLCEEMFMTGTAAQITAVTRIDHRPVGTGVMGPITSGLRQAFDRVVHAQNPRYLAWNMPVYPKKDV
ncbi:MAG: branched-chain amino acid transaminase [Chloroflexota bacterium]